MSKYIERDRTAYVSSFFNVTDIKFCSPEIGVCHPNKYVKEKPYLK